MEHRYSLKYISFSGKHTDISANLTFSSLAPLLLAFVFSFSTLGISYVDYGFSQEILSEFITELISDLSIDFIPTGFAVILGCFVLGQKYESKFYSFVWLLVFYLSFSFMFISFLKVFFITQLISLFVVFAFVFYSQKILIDSSNMDSIY